MTGLKSSRFTTLWKEFDWHFYNYLLLIEVLFITWIRDVHLPWKGCMTKGKYSPTVELIKLSLTNTHIYFIAKWYYINTNGHIMQIKPIIFMLRSSAPICKSIRPFHWQLTKIFTCEQNVTKEIKYSTKIPEFLCRYCCQNKQSPTTLFTVTFEIWSEFKFRTKRTNARKKKKTKNPPKRHAFSNIWKLFSERFSSALYAS